MPAFAGMTLTFLSHPPILNDSCDWSCESFKMRSTKFLLLKQPQSCIAYLGRVLKAGNDIDGGNR